MSDTPGPFCIGCTPDWGSTGGGVIPHPDCPIHSPNR